VQHDLGTRRSRRTSASRFWLFQAIEAGIFFAVAVALLAFSVWWIRRRIS
jgi:hypothetical protein